MICLKKVIFRIISRPRAQLRNLAMPISSSVSCRLVFALQIVALRGRGLPPLRLFGRGRGCRRLCRGPGGGMLEGELFRDLWMDLREKYNSEGERA